MFITHELLKDVHIRVSSIFLASQHSIFAAYTSPPADVCDISDHSVHYHNLGSVLTFGWLLRSSSVRIVPYNMNTLYNINGPRTLSCGILSRRYQLKMPSGTLYRVALVRTNVSVKVSSPSSGFLSFIVVRHPLHRRAL
jgi:hypothetical protein